MALDVLNSGERLGRDGVEVAHKEVDRPAKLGSTIRGDHRRAHRQLDRGRPIRPVGENNDDSGHAQNHRKPIDRNVAEINQNRRKPSPMLSP